MRRSSGYATEWDVEPRAGYGDLTKVTENPVRIVFRATDRGTRLPVSITVCRAQLDEATGAHFLSDCVAVSRLGARPDVLAPLDFGFDPNGQPYVVTEEFSPVSLAHEVRESPLRWSDAVAIGARMAEVIGSAHRRGVLHGDMAPIRIKRDNTGRPRLEGLAIARIECGMRMRGASPVALQHLAPEVLRGGPATIATDVYSIASTTFALATGTGPFAPREGEHPQAWLERIEHERPDLRADDIPAALVPVLERALATDPSARPPSAAALARQLRAVQAGRVVPSGPAAAAEAKAMTTRRRRKAGRGPRTVALLAMIIALLTTAYVISNSSEEPATTATATGPVTVPADSLVHQLEGFALGTPIEPEARTSIEQNLLPLAGTTSPSEVIAALRFLEPLGDSTAIAFVVGPPRAKANILFRRPSDCLGKTERVGGQPVCVTRLDDGSTLLRWGGSDVWLGVFTEQRSDFGPAVMSGLVKSSLSSG